MYTLYADLVHFVAIITSICRQYKTLTITRRVKQDNDVAECLTQIQITAVDVFPISWQAPLSGPNMNIRFHTVVHEYLISRYRPLREIPIIHERPAIQHTYKPELHRTIVLTK